jgi:hypothetical protein
MASESRGSLVEEVASRQGVASRESRVTVASHHPTLFWYGRRAVVLLWLLRPSIL